MSIKVIIGQIAMRVIVHRGKLQIKCFVMVRNVSNFGSSDII